MRILDNRSYEDVRSPACWIATGVREGGNVIGLGFADLEMMPDGSARLRIVEAVVFAPYSPEGNSKM